MRRQAVFVVVQSFRTFALACRPGQLLSEISRQPGISGMNGQIATSNLAEIITMGEAYHTHTLFFTSVRQNVVKLPNFKPILNFLKC